MAEQMRPSSNKDAPDPSNSYERSHPEREAGMGRLDQPKHVPHDSPDKQLEAATNRQDPTRQLNAHDTVDQRAAADPNRPLKQPDHSMFEEEPDGWDQAPLDIHDPQNKRHPRKEGKGGTP